MAAAVIIICIVAILIAIVLKGTHPQEEVKSAGMNNYRVPSTDPRNTVLHNVPKAVTYVDENLNNNGLLLFIDTETTGLIRKGWHPVKDYTVFPRIVSIAWMVTDMRRILKHREYFIIKQETPIDPDAIAIHGITDEIAAEKGVELGDVLALLRTQMQGAKYVIAHNVDFDLDILKAAYTSVGSKHPFGKMKKRCTMKSGTRYCAIEKPYGKGYKWPTLKELAEDLQCIGRGTYGLHNAEYDMKLMEQCFWQLYRMDYISLD